MIPGPHLKELSASKGKFIRMRVFGHTQERKYLTSPTVPQEATPEPDLKGLVIVCCTDVPGKFDVSRREGDMKIYGSFWGHSSERQ